MTWNREIKKQINKTNGTNSWMHEFLNKFDQHEHLKKGPILWGKVLDMPCSATKILPCPGVSSDGPEVVCACGSVRSRASKAPERLLPCKCGAEACDAKDLEEWRQKQENVTWKLEKGLGFLKFDVWKLRFLGEDSIDGSLFAKQLEVYLTFSLCGVSIIE